MLELDEQADHLKATKRVDPQRMRSIIGIAKVALAGKTTRGWLEELRGPLDLPSHRRQ